MELDPGWDEEGLLEGPPGDRADPAVAEAIPAIEGHLRANRDVFYLRQIQVIFEKPFFHWVTSRAVRELVGAGRLLLEQRPLRPDQGEGGPLINFVFHPRARYTRRLIARKLDLIRRFSAEDVTRACGRHAEVLFSRALMARGFALVAENVRTYRGRVWEEHNRDLDFIVERDGLAYGCEVKNRFEYMERDELELKVRLCQHLGLVPIFIVRAAAKSYINLVAEAGGFTKVFVAHIYPFGFGNLVEQIRADLPGMPVDSPRDLPATILDSFLGWHGRRVEPQQRAPSV